MSVIERLKKGTSKLTITKLSYNAPAYVRAMEQEIELMGIIEQQAKQIESMKEILGDVLSDCYLSDGMRSEIEKRI